nr:brachyurin-like [Onthophagus taurus]
MLFLFYVCLGILCCTKNVLSSLTFLKPTHLESKIVGGEEVSANSISFMAGLFITKPTGLYLCGGVLISTKYVLTSANCLEYSTSVEVRLGAHKVNQEESTQIRLTSTKFNIHGDWNSTSLTNDIATIVLPSAVTPNNYIKPVSLPGRADKDTTFSGEWGVTFEDAIPDTSVDWSQVKHLNPRIPVPFGLDKLLFKERIVGGWESERNALPYMAAIIVTKGTGNYLCGGSLISQVDVLTSAQCLIGAFQAQVILGAHRLDVIEATQQRFYSSQFEIHHGYEPDLFINDIAAIKLQAAVQLNDFVSIVAVPRFEDVVHNFAGEVAVVSGWGLTSDAEVTPSEVLKKLFAEVIDNIVCNISLLGNIQATHICTSGEGSIGACAGDAGAPLVFEYMQIGVVSFSVNLGCEAQWPTVYTRLTFYLDWLETHTEAHIA